MTSRNGRGPDTTRKSDLETLAGVSESKVASSSTSAIRDKGVDVRATRREELLRDRTPSHFSSPTCTY